ncbi:hypothetical protein K501DRAFT_332480 [Backusella circina FSU 941]|nr:hypothetical protein K501DRAFT_332480 [Backusella circina FSU 941]
MDNLLNDSIYFDRSHGFNKSNSSLTDTDSIPLQAYKSRLHDESRDDNEFIGAILQRSATSSTKKKSEPKEEPSHEDEELRVAMERAWALLDGKEQDEGDEPQHESNPTPVEAAQMVSSGRIQTVPLRTLTTRIYIDDANNHKVVQLTNLLTSAMVIQYLKRKGLLDSSDDWTLFEIANSHGVERPIREWEIVLDTVSAWEPDAGNALLVKKYSYHYTLTSENVLQKSTSLMHGWLSIEYKKGKWQKRYCFIKDNAIYHAKDNKNISSASILCHLATYDVYTLLQPLKASPTPFVFSIRAQDKSSNFEREGDYIRFLAVEDQDEMKDWVLSIRYTKSNIQYKHHPNRVTNPLAHIQLDNEHQRIDKRSNSVKSEEKPKQQQEQPKQDQNEEHASPPLRRHKSTRELQTKSNSNISDDHVKYISTLPRSESTRRVDETKKPTRTGTTSRSLGRSGTTRRTNDEPEGPLVDCSNPSAFAKGSLLAAKEEQIEQQHRQHEESNTLIQIDDRVKFSKGSLLEQKVARQKSVRDPLTNTTIIEPEHRRHVSLKRKPTKSRHHDAPLPNTTPITSTSPPPSSTLLRLDDTPERFHSRELLGRHVKPLVNFDSNDSQRIRK